MLTNIYIMQLRISIIHINNVVMTHNLYVGSNNCCECLTI